MTNFQSSRTCVRMRPEPSLSFYARISYLALVPALMAFALVDPASAAQVQFVAPGVAGSVTGVIANGQTWNVTFEGRLTHQQWATQLDFATEDDAENAALALAAALNAQAVTAVRFQLTSSTFDHTGAVTWYASNGTSIFGEDTLRSGGTWVLGNPLPGGSTAPLNTSRPLAADWTLAAPPAPVPTAIPLAQIGLTGLLATTGFLQSRRLLAPRDGGAHSRTRTRS